MRIKNICCEWSADFFGPRMMEKYNLSRYDKDKHKDEPVVFFGCYGRLTKAWIMNHRGLVVIVWSGSDSLRLHEDTVFVRHVKDRPDRIFNIAHSHWIQKDLDHWGLPYIDRVVLPADLSRFKFEPGGSKVYHYGSKQREWYYGTTIMKKIRDKWSGNIRYPEVVIAGHNAYNQDELYQIYKDSFIGVRLTEHDNMALSCIEMGLMGRRSIFNGNIPCAISYGSQYLTYDTDVRKRWVYQNDTLQGKVEKMILEADREPDKLLAEEMREFVYDDEAWLYTKYYE